MSMYRSSSEQTGRVNFLFSLLLLFVFLISAIFLILIGSQVYTNIREKNSQSFSTDTASNYIINKVRQFDHSEAITIREIEDTSILVLISEQEGSIYETWIYAEDGVLKELFTPQNSGLTKKDGLSILPCYFATFSFEEKTRLLTITLQPTKDSPDYSTHLLLRSDHSFIQTK